MVAPIVQELSQGSTETVLAGLDQAQQQVYVSGLLSAFGCMEASVIAAPMGSVFPALLELVRKALSEPDKEVALRGAPATMQMVIPALFTTQRLQLCHLLISMNEPAGQVCSLLAP